MWPLHIEVEIVQGRAPRGGLTARLPSVHLFILRQRICLYGNGEDGMTGFSSEPLSTLSGRRYLSAAYKVRSDGR